MSKRDVFHDMMKNFLNASAFDVFTVMPSGTVESPSTDIRFAAHGSPYYAPEKIEYILAINKKELQESLNIEVVMVHIDECLIEGEQKFYNIILCVKTKLLEYFSKKVNKNL